METSTGSISSTVDCLLSRSSLRIVTLPDVWHEDLPALDTPAEEDTTTAPDESPVPLMEALARRCRVFVTASWKGLRPRQRTWKLVLLTARIPALGLGYSAPRLTAIQRPLTQRDDPFSV